MSFSGYALDREWKKCGKGDKNTPYMSLIISAAKNKRARLSKRHNLFLRQYLIYLDTAWSVISKPSFRPIRLRMSFGGHLFDVNRSGLRQRRSDVWQRVHNDGRKLSTTSGHLRASPRRLWCVCNLYDWCRKCLASVPNTAAIQPPYPTQESHRHLQPVQTTTGHPARRHTRSTENYATQRSTTCGAVKPCGTWRAPRESASNHRKVFLTTCYKDVTFQL